jgi:Polysaccharide lyase
MASPRAGVRSSHLQGAALLAIIVILVAVVATGVGLAATQTPRDVTWRGDFETGNWSQWGTYHVQTGPGASATIGTSAVRQGRYAAIFTVGRDGAQTGTKGERAQLWVNQEETRGYEGEDVWYAWSTRIAPGSVLDSGGWNDLTAWHHTGTVCPAPVHVAITGSTRMLRLDAWGGKLDERSCLNPFRKTWNFGRLKFGKWYDFVFHVKWSPDPNVGSVAMWINGKLVLPTVRAATLYSGQGVYLKQGYYRGHAQGTTVIYNDGTVVAHSYAGAITAFRAGSWPSTPDDRRRRFNSDP